jgi:hypothetical protein
VPARRRGPVLVALATVLVLLATTWALWATVFHTRAEVTSQLLTFDVRGEHVADATWTVVRRDAGVRASCLLRAVAADHSVVGELTVAVTSGPATSQQRSTLRTERRATGVDLVGCTAPGQTGPR